MKHYSYISLPIKLAAVGFMEWSVKLLCFIATVRLNLDFWHWSYGPWSPSQLVLWCCGCRSLRWRGTWARLPERGRKRSGGEWLPFAELTSAPLAGGEHCESASHTESHQWPDRWGFSKLMLHPRGTWLENRCSLVTFVTHLQPIMEKIQTWWTKASPLGPNIVAH